MREINHHQFKLISPKKVITALTKTWTPERCWLNTKKSQDLRLKSSTLTQKLRENLMTRTKCKQLKISHQGSQISRSTTTTSTSSLLATTLEETRLTSTLMLGPSISLPPRRFGCTSKSNKAKKLTKNFKELPKKSTNQNVREKKFCLPKKIKLSRWPRTWWGRMTKKLSSKQLLKCYSPLKPMRK